MKASQTMKALWVPADPLFEPAVLSSTEAPPRPGLPNRRLGRAILPSGSADLALLTSFNWELPGGSRNHSISRGVDDPGGLARHLHHPTKLDRGQ